AEVRPLRTGLERGVQRALRDLEGGVGASVGVVVEQLHLEALGGAVDGAHGARGPEGDPPRFDGRALAHDLRLRVAVASLWCDRTPPRWRRVEYPLRIFSRAPRTPPRPRRAADRSSRRHRRATRTRPPPRAARSRARQRARCARHPPRAPPAAPRAAPPRR